MDSSDIRGCRDLLFVLDEQLYVIDGRKRAADRDDVKGHEILLPDYDFVVCENLSGRIGSLLVRQPGNPDFLQSEIQQTQKSTARSETGKK